MNKKPKKRKKIFVKLFSGYVLWMHSLDVFMQTALVLGAMRAVRTTFLRILAAFDLQVTPHVSQPAVILAAVRTLEYTWLLVKITRKF